MPPAAAKEQGLEIHYATSRQVWNALRHVSAMRRLWLMQGRCLACG